MKRSPYGASRSPASASASGSRSMPTTRASVHRRQDRLAVAAEAEGGIDEHGAVVVERGCQKSDDPVEEDRDVGGGGHGGSYRPRLTRRRSSAAAAGEAAAENIISAAVSRAWCRTRRTRASGPAGWGVGPTKRGGAAHGFDPRVLVGGAEWRIAGSGPCPLPVGDTGAKPVAAVRAGWRLPTLSLSSGAGEGAEDGYVWNRARPRSAAGERARDLALRCARGLVVVR